MTQSLPLYPLKFKPALKEKVWGGHKLEPILHLPSTGKKIGEAWLVWDGLRTEEGPLQGRTLRELTQSYGEALLGTQSAGAKDFPLLIKFLDPQEFLSVQNHPNDAYAQQHEGVPYGKNEAWLVLQAEPGTQLIHGLKREVSREELRQAMRDNKLMALCDYVPAKAGDVFINTPGVVHALGTGIVIYEVQQSSDVTYRLYDWDRKPLPGEPVRELHIDKGADVADLRPIQQHNIKPVVLHEAGLTRTLLVACRYYASEKLEIHAQTTQHTAGRSFHILTALQGQGRVQVDGAYVELSSGESVLVPACMGEYNIDPVSPALTIIKSYVPDLQQDIVAPLRAHGIAWQDIAQLGGDALRTDFAITPDP
jgi:mannose-6-phosphate isomerase